MFFASGFMLYVEGQMEHGLRRKPEGEKQNKSYTTPVQGQIAMKLERSGNRWSASRLQPEILHRAQ